MLTAKLKSGHQRIRIGFDLKRDPFERLSDEFNDMYEMRRRECPLQEGVVDRLRELKNAGIQHTLLSAYGQERLLEIVEFYGLSSLFCAVWGLDNSSGEGKVERQRDRREEDEDQRDDVPRAAQRRERQHDPACAPRHMWGAKG